MKKIYFDLETTSINPLTANILECCFMFTVDRKILKSYTSKIKFNKRYSELSQLEKDTLKFNNIYDEVDLEEHNSVAIEWEEYFIEVWNYYLTYFKDNNTKIGLSGWNNTAFNNIIFNRIAGFKHYSQFDYHSRDIMQRYLILKEIGFIKKLSLSKVYCELIDPKGLEFHTAYDDCIATKELDEYYEDNYIDLTMYK